MTEKEETPLVEAESGLGPKGSWSTGLCGCTQLCFTKSLWWMGWCCNCILIGQLMQRMGLSFFASKDKSMAKNTCKIITFLGVLALGLRVLFIILALEYGEQIVGFIFGVFMLYVGTCLRSVIREKYEISPQNCGGCNGLLEDFCCMLWCACCSTIQMARQTHDETVHPYTAFSETGLKAEVAPMVV